MDVENCIWKILDNIKLFEQDVVEKTSMLTNQEFIYTIFNEIQVTFSSINEHLLKAIETEQNKFKNSIENKIWKKITKRNINETNNKTIDDYFQNLSINLKQDERELEFINDCNVQKIGTLWLNELQDELERQDNFGILDMILKKKGFLNFYYKQYIFSVIGKEPPARTQVSRFIKKLKKHEQKHDENREIEIDANKNEINDTSFSINQNLNYYPFKETSNNTFQSPIIPQLEQNYHTESNISNINNSQHIQLFKSFSERSDLYLNLSSGISLENWKSNGQESQFGSGIKPFNFFEKKENKKRK